MNASGCLDALEAPGVARSLDAFVTKTVTLESRAGNAPTRIAETSVGMLNSIGLQNLGLERFLRETLPRLETLGVPLWVSVGGEGEDVARCCAALDAHRSVAAIELNVSCPNVETPAEDASAVVEAARAATGKPLWAKLSPAVPDIAAVAEAVAAAGADGLSLVNTVRGLALDEQSLQPRLGTAVGGLSGPALRPIALAAVYACYRATPLPIVGMGGVGSGRDALELLAVGAGSIALGTVLFSDPGAPGRIRLELAAAVAAAGFATPGEAVGAAHRSPLTSPAKLRLRSRV